jgi:hypothetical protein
MSHKPNVDGAIPNQITIIDRDSNGTVVFLDHTLTASQARASSEIRIILTGLLKEALVVLMNDKYHYRVNFGSKVQPHTHIVSWDWACTCNQAEDCVAVVAVKKYLLPHFQGNSALHG